MPDVLPGSLEAQALREYANRPAGEDVPGEWFLQDPEKRERLELAASLDGDKDARKELVLAHMPLVRAYVDQPHIGKHSPFRLDLLQEGYKALMIAAHKFDPDRGTTFGTYAFAVVERKVDALKARLRSAVSLGQEALRFSWKWKQTRRGFKRKHHREPVSVDLIQELARVAAEEIRPIWLDRWPEDRPVSERLEKVAAGDAGADDVNKAITCIHALRAALVRPTRLDEHEDYQEGQGASVPSDETRAPIDKLEVVDGEARFPAVGSAHPRYNPGASRAGDAIVDKITREKKGRPSREQEQRNLHRAERQALWEIVNLPTLLTSRQRFLMMLRLGADGRGSRGLPEATEIMTDVRGERVRRDSVVRTLSRAIQRVKDYVAGSGAGPEGLYNPWHGLSLAEGDPLRENVARSNREHVLNGDGPSRWFNPYEDPVPGTHGRGRISNPWPEDVWQDAIREAMRPEPTRPDRDWPDGSAESFRPDTRTGRDPVTGIRCRSAPGRPIGSSRYRSRWSRIQPLSRPRLGKPACRYGRVE